LPFHRGSFDLRAARCGAQSRGSAVFVALHLQTAKLGGVTERRRRSLFGAEGDRLRAGAWEGSRSALMPRTVTHNPRIDREIAKLDKAARKAAREAAKNGDTTQHDRERAQIEALRRKKRAKV
jgi:hypothetical protein